MFQNDATKCLTGEVRLSYVHLAEPYVNPQQPNEEPKYQATLLIPKSDYATKQDIDDAINAAINAAVSGKKWNGVRPPIVTTTVHDGDGTRKNGMPYGDECKGMWVINASRKAQKCRMWVCDISNPNVELAPQNAYSGMYARCVIQFYGYSNSGNKGIGCELHGVMRTRDGEPLDGAVRPSAKLFEQCVPDTQAGAQYTGQINPVTGQPM